MEAIKGKTGVVTNFSASRTQNTLFGAKILIFEGDGSNQR